MRIYSAFSHDSVTVLGINKSSSALWLRTYSAQKSISFPFIFDSNGSLHTLYEVGTIYGNVPPTYIIIDKKGMVQYRTDAKFGKAAEMAARVRELLSSQ